MKKNTWIYILLAVAVIAAVVYVLYKQGILKLFGSKVATPLTSTTRTTTTSSGTTTAPIANSNLTTTTAAGSSSSIIEQTNNLAVLAGQGRG